MTNRHELLERVGAIARDHRSGAAQLARESVEVLRQAFQVDPATVDLVACGLCRAQPTMASLWNAAALAVGEGGLRAVEHFARRLERAERSLARNLASVVMLGHSDDHRPGPLTLATVSASSTVSACLTELAELTPIRVICAEGRPGFEGRRVAAALADSGISVTLCTDGGIGAVVHAAPRVDAAVVGADAVSGSWFMNKCGTRLLLTTAASLGVPGYVIAGRDKFVSERLAAELSIVDQSPAEVWAEAPDGVSISNPYFERIPLDDIGAFVTDVGPIGSGAVPQVCRTVVPPGSTARLVELLSRPTGS